MKVTDNSMPLCDVVAFDLDGTLVDTLGLHIAATRAAVRAVFHTTMPEDEIRCSLGHPLQESMAIMSAGRGQEHVLLREFMRYYVAHQADGATTFPEVASVLTTLQNRGLRLALISNKLRRWGNEEIDRLDLRRFFEVVVFVEDMPSPKPSGLALSPVLRAIQVAPQHVLVIGDSETDLICARAAGALSGAALWGTYQPENLYAQSPDYLFQSLSDVVDVLAPDDR